MLCLKTNSFTELRTNLDLNGVEFSKRTESKASLQQGYVPHEACIAYVTQLLSRKNILNARLY